MQLKLFMCIVALFLGATSALSLDNLLDLDADLLNGLDGKEEEPSPPAFCSIASDVLFIVDSDSNLGTIKTFVRAVVAGLDVADDLTRVSLALFAEHIHPRFFFNTFNNKLDVMQAINDAPYFGGRIGRGHLRAPILHQSNKGWRGNLEVPSAVVFITAYTHGVQRHHAEYYQSKATRVITVGIGAAVDAAELRRLATTEDDALLLVDAFNLTGEIQGILEKICAMDSDVNECLRDDLNNCQQLCFNEMNGFTCACQYGYNLVDDTNCELEHSRPVNYYGKYGPWKEVESCSRPTTGPCSGDNTCCNKAKGQRKLERECNEPGRCNPDFRHKMTRPCKIQCAKQVPGKYGPWKGVGSCLRHETGACSAPNTCCNKRKGVRKAIRTCKGPGACNPKIKHEMTRPCRLQCD